MSALSDLVKGNTSPTATATKTASRGSALASLLDEKPNQPPAQPQALPKTPSSPSKNVAPTGGTKIGENKYQTPSGSIWEYLPDGTRVVTMPSRFGGGAYNIDPKNTGSVVNTGHTNYGGEEAQSGSQRDDIIPVGLGGNNSKSENIRMEKELPKGKQSQFVHTSTDALEGQLAKDVKSGKITLAQARLKIMTEKQDAKPSVLDRINNAGDTFSRGVEQGTNMVLGKTGEKDFVENPVKSFGVGLYNTYTKPSNAEQHTEQQLGLNRGDPVSQFFGKLITRTLSGVTEPYASLVGEAFGDQNIAKKVGNEQLPAEVLGKTGKLTVNDYADAIMKSIPLALSLVPFVTKFANKGVLKLSDITKTDSSIELTRSEISDITRGREDLVDPVKVQAFKTAIKDDLGQQLKATGRFNVPKTEDNATSNFLKNSATRPIQEVKNFTKKYGVDTSVPNTKLLPERITFTEKPIPEDVIKNHQSYDLVLKGNTIDYVPKPKGYSTPSALEAPPSQSKFGARPKVGLLSAPKEQYATGEGFEMTAKADKQKLEVMKAINGYRDAVASFNENPTPTKLKRVQSAKALVDDAKQKLANPQQPSQQGRQESTPQASKSVGLTTTKVPVKTQAVEAEAPTKSSGSSLKALNETPQTPLVEKPTPAPTSTIPKPTKTSAKVDGQTPSRVGRSIEQKAVEQKLTQGFKGVAGYDAITIKDQAEKATTLLSDPEKAMRVIKGEDSLPEGLRGASLITAAEEHIRKTGDVRMAYELANSPLVSETSSAAQEMRLVAERQPDGITSQMQGIRKAREAALQKKVGNLVKAKKSIKLDIQKEVKAVVPKAKDWASFLEEIKCT